MEISVESRVKAHISTPYIDADGRGTQGAFAVDYADCMKSPLEFSKIQHGAGEDHQLLQQLEDRHAEVTRKAKQFHESLKQREADRLQGKVVSAAALADSIGVQRELQREEAQKKESAALDEAYHHRLDSDEAMNKYEGLLRESTESKLRRKEVEVRARHDRLAQLAQQGREHQARVIEQQRMRDARIHGIEERMVRQALEERRRQEAAEAERERREAVARAIAERNLQENVAKDVDALRRAAAAEEERIASLHRRKVAEEQQVLQTVATHSKQQHDLAMRQTEGSIHASYERLRSLQLDHEAAVRLLQLEIERHSNCSKGSFLEVLMASAREASEADGKLFRGLDLLCNATLKPSAVTPGVLPASEAARVPRSVGTMTDAAAPRTPPVARKR
jgi:hypothetical protein